MLCAVCFYWAWQQMRQLQLSSFQLLLPVHKAGQSFRHKPGCHDHLQCKQMTCLSCNTGLSCIYSSVNEGATARTRAPLFQCMPSGVCTGVNCTITICTVRFFCNPDRQTSHFRLMMGEHGCSGCQQCATRPLLSWHTYSQRHAA